MRSPSSSASFASASESDCSTIRKCPDAANRSTRPREVARPVEIDDVGGCVADLERGRVRQHQQLHDRHDQDLRQRRAVADDVQDFGPGERQDPAHRHSSRSWNERVLSGEQHDRHPGQDQRLLPEDTSRPTPFSMMLRAISTNHRAGTMFVTICERHRHALDREDEARQQHRRQHRAEHRAHHRDALRRRARRNQDAERERHEDEQQAFGEQQDEAAAQRHVEDSRASRITSRTLTKPTARYGQDLADDDLPRAAAATPAAPRSCRSPSRASARSRSSAPR